MNINVSIGEILTKAWKITWKFKVLWIFGILASCGANRNSNFNYNLGGNNNNDNPPDLRPGDLPEPFRSWMSANWQDTFTSFLTKNLILLVLVALLILAILFLFYYLGTIGKTGLIKGAQLTDRGAESLSFGELWNQGNAYFLRMFGLSLLVGLPILILAFIVAAIVLVPMLGLIGSHGSSQAIAATILGSLGILVPSVCCLAIVSILVRLIVEQAKTAMVVEDLGVIASLQRGWNVFSRNFMTIIVVSIILTVIGAVIGFLVAIPVLIVVFPTLVGVVMAGSRHADIAASLTPLMIAGICVLAYAPIALIVRGIELAYGQSALTLTYLRLTAPTPPESPVESIDAQ